VSKPECVDCRAAENRPAVPRPIDPRSGPRKPRCATHYRAAHKERKQRESDARSRRRSGLDEDTRQEILDEQGRACPCGSTGNRRLNLAADHDHDISEDHDHAEEVACLECMRGFLCDACNRLVIGQLRGRYKSDARVVKALRGLADYMEHPPAARVRARRLA
jgi:hypothetical protein